MKPRAHTGGGGQVCETVLDKSTCSSISLTMSGDSSSNVLLAPAGFVVREAEGQGAVPSGGTRRPLWACTSPAHPGLGVCSDTLAGRAAPLLPPRTNGARSPLLGPAARRATECSQCPLWPQLSLRAPQHLGVDEGTSPPGPAPDLGGCHPSTRLGLVCSQCPPSFPKLRLSPARSRWGFPGGVVVTQHQASCHPTTEPQLLPLQGFHSRWSQGLGRATEGWWGRASTLGTGSELPDGRCVLSSGASWASGPDPRGHGPPAGVGVSVCD